MTDGRVTYIKIHLQIKGEIGERQQKIASATNQKMKLIKQLIFIRLSCFCINSA